MWCRWNLGCNYNCASVLVFCFHRARLLNNQTSCGISVPILLLPPSLNNLSKRPFRKRYNLHKKMRGFRFYIVKYKEEKKWVCSSFLSESSPLNALFSFCKLIMLSKHKELNPFSKLRLHYIFAGKPLFWSFRLPLFFLCAISLCWTHTRKSFFAQNRGCIVY